MNCVQQSSAGASGLRSNNGSIALHCKGKWGPTRFTQEPLRAQTLLAQSPQKLMFRRICWGCITFAGLGHMPGQCSSVLAKG
eukprot:CAMPEP_0171072964 /NCGR_PEP_ID=MMETSP0766_2-20121228/11206_1 /TAXON_ID=439317 /ORGANISM="Gambierdiscus australes, Strain CAWD 149" /LENGTH=81 /DNA_ID=CAMNT_0011529611 /DNA_START=241 /DNA_END=486 /DNA_ORIENTATION=-